jgi:hypothetical protein
MKRITITLASAALAAGLLPVLAWAQMLTPAERGVMTPPMYQESMPSNARVNWVHGQRYVSQSEPVYGAYGSYGYGYPYAAAYGYGYPDTRPYEYPYANPYGYYSNNYGNPFSVVTAPIAALTAPVTALATPVAQAATTPFAVAGEASAPLVTGRSVAAGQMGIMCSTPVTTCELYQASWIGNGCSCKITGGHSRGSVAP